MSLKSMQQERLHWATLKRGLRRGSRELYNSKAPAEEAECKARRSPKMGCANKAVSRSVSSPEGSL